MKTREHFAIFGDTDFNVQNWEGDSTLAEYCHIQRTHSYHFDAFLQVTHLPMNRASILRRNGTEGGSAKTKICENRRDIQQLLGFPMP